MATKKADAENIQNVPVALTAYNDKQIELLKVRDLQSLAYTSPNVALDDVGTTKGVANFSIRGLGINSSIPSIDFSGFICSVWRIPVAMMILLIESSCDIASRFLNIASLL